MLPLLHLGNTQLLEEVGETPQGTGGEGRGVCHRPGALWRGPHPEGGVTVKLRFPTAKCKVGLVGLRRRR